jgi:hypothetical protein
MIFSPHPRRFLLRCGKISDQLTAGDNYVQHVAHHSNAQLVAIAADVRVRVLVALVSLSLVLPLILKLGAELLRGT